MGALKIPELKFGDFRRYRSIWMISACALFLQGKAWAWNHHQAFMPFILKATPPEIQQVLIQSSTAPCASDDLKIIESLIAQLQLNSSTQVPSTTDQHCGEGTQLFVESILLSGSVDDPDRGMDQELPDDPRNTFDPHQDRTWMGGYQGPTSQGFRHMYFGGWSVWHPFTTFQVPPRSLGQAPYRAELMASKAKELLQSENLIWGTRLLTWAMHYIQDLSQPFHAVQFPNLKMVPWFEIFSWPPQEAFQQLRKETTRIVTNYHWAYEDYVHHQILLKEKGPFYPCLTEPEKFSTLNLEPSQKSPKKIAFAVIEASIQHAARLGDAEVQFFGGKVAAPGVDLTKNPNLIDYNEYAVRPDLSKPRDEIHAVTCEALANTSLATRLLISWAFQP